jgi:hypothetical protein
VPYPSAVKHVREVRRREDFRMPASLHRNTFRRTLFFLISTFRL